MPDWKTGEMEFLLHLALKGPSDQRSISKATGLPPSTINAAKDALTEKGYIELIERKTMGRGAPRKIFALTPIGLLAAVTFGKLWDKLDEVLSHWREISPIFLRRFKALKDWGFEDYVKDFCDRFLAEEKALSFIARYKKYLKAYKIKDVFIYSTDEMEGAEEVWFWTGHISRMNYKFYEHILKIGVESPKMEDFIELLKRDEELKEGWLNWFKIKEKTYKKLKEFQKSLITN